MGAETTRVQVSVGDIALGRRSLPVGVRPGDVVALDGSDVRWVVERIDEVGGALHVTVALSWDERGPSSHRSTTIVPSTDGVEVAVHDLGGAGHPVMICHATGFHGLAYAPFAAALAEHHRVLAVDLRGHGATNVPSTGDLAWSGMAEDVAAVLDAMFDVPPFAIGHSMGGASILMAELERPGSIRAAWLFEPIVFPGPWEPSPNEQGMAAAAAGRRAEFPTRRAAFERYGARPPLNELRVDALASYVQHGFVDGETPTDPVHLACAPATESATFGTPVKLGLHELDPISMPIRVAAGRPLGGVGPQAMAVELAAGVPTAEFSDHPHLGHFGPLEAPDELAANASAFFADVQANTPG